MSSIHCTSGELFTCLQGLMSKNKSKKKGGLKPSSEVDRLVRISISDVWAQKMLQIIPVGSGYIGMKFSHLLYPWAISSCAKKKVETKWIQPGRDASSEMRKWEPNDCQVICINDTETWYLMSSWYDSKFPFGLIIVKLFSRLVKDYDLNRWEVSENPMAYLERKG